MTMRLSKIDVARHQLVTGIRLVFEDRDPVSVHTLAHNAWEIANTLAEKQGTPRMMPQLMQDNRKTEKEIIAAARKHRNFFKHADRDHSQLSEEFSDLDNDALLFVACYDFTNIDNKSPIESQVYVVWYMAANPQKINESACEQWAAPSEQIQDTRSPRPDWSSRGDE